MSDEYEAGLRALVARHTREVLELELTQLAEFADLARRTHPGREAYWQRRIEARVRSFQASLADRP